MYLKTKLLILFLLGGLSLYGQSFMYSYTDPCTFELKTITYDMTTPVVISYYGQTLHLHTMKCKMERSIVG